MVYKYRPLDMASSLYFIKSYRKNKSLPLYPSLCEMCTNTEFLLVCIIPHSDWIRRDTSYLSVFIPNAGKYGPEKTPYLDTFHAVHELSRVILKVSLAALKPWTFSAQVNMFSWIFAELFFKQSYCHSKKKIFFLYNFNFCP